MQTLPDVSRRVAERTEVEWSERDGRVTVRRPRPGGFRRTALRLLRLPTETTVHLDEVGSSAWRLMDGTRTVAEIRSELVARHPDIGDLSARLGRFLGVMVSKGFVRLR